MAWAERRAVTREVLPPVLAAVALDFFLTLLLRPPQGTFPVASRVASFLVSALIAVAVGVYLGKRTWPRMGMRLARFRLKRALSAKNAPLVFLTDRPDFALPLRRRILEVVGFAAGISTILPALLAVASVRTSPLVGSTTLLTLAALWASFLVVPFWLYSRMGLRRVDPVRWLVEPLSRAYGSSLRMSNGALLLFAVGAVANLALRAGASLNEALTAGVLAVAHVVAVVLIAAATGVVVYVRAEHGLVRALEAESLSWGLRDGRGMTDGQFLPRLP